MWGKLAKRKWNMREREREGGDGRNKATALITPNWPALRIMSGQSNATLKYFAHSF